MMPNSFSAYYPLLRSAVLATVFLVAGSVSTGVAKEGPILNAAGEVTGQRELRFGARMRDVRQGPDGYLYVLIDDDDGHLIRIKPIIGGDTAP